MTDITLILPAYNEAQSIERTVQQAVRYFEKKVLSFEIIVAADGTDGTREVVGNLASSDSRIRVIGHAERCGKGRGVREAVRLASGQIIGFADADNKVPIEEFDRFLPFLEGGQSIVIGSRAMKESVIQKRQPLHRQLGSRGFTYVLWAIVGVLAEDTQCGFKFFSRDAAMRIFELQKIDGYMFDVEVLALAKALGFGVAEVPVTWRDDRDSRLQLFRDNVRHVIDLFRIRASMAGVTHEKASRVAALTGRR